MVMIICHEGLPGSGKSYEAIVKHVLAALKSNRPVYSNIRGLKDGIPKISQLTDQSEQHLDTLIHELSDDDIKTLGKGIPKDVLVVLDELQNYYPSGRQKLDPEVIKYVSEHRHHGHDIIIMTQSFDDIAPLFRRRTQRKISFFKRTAIGQPNKYTWIAYEATQPEKFKKINSGGGEYETKYFGTYKSHLDDTDNKQLQYEDSRANIFTDKKMFIGIPVFLAVCVYAVFHLYYFFQPETEPKTAISSKPVKTTQQQISIPTPPPSNADVEESYSDYFDEVASTYSLHLSATISGTDGVITHAIIQLLDAQYNLKEQFTIPEVLAFGWSINQKPYGFQITKDGKHHIARPFPRSDLYGRINNVRSESL